MGHVISKRMHFFITDDRTIVFNTSFSYKNALVKVSVRGIFVLGCVWVVSYWIRPKRLICVCIYMYSSDSGDSVWLQKIPQTSSLTSYLSSHARIYLPQDGRTLSKLKIKAQFIRVSNCQYTINIGRPLQLESATTVCFVLIHLLWTHLPPAMNVSPTFWTSCFRQFAVQN